MKKFYVTTAIPYVNAAPHIGFALEIIQADVLARYHRLRSDETFFLTGVDEHGVKLYDTAKEAKMDTQAYADVYAEKFKALKEVLNLSNDDFIRTTSARHKKGAQKLWSIMFEKGDIYKGSYKGNYCVGCESFIPDKDLDENGFCPNHKKKPVILEEENYFFKLSKYSKQIADAIKSDKMKVVPESRKNEILNLIESGFNDVSFSRPKSVLPWGIDVPNDDTQVMYVWCDALTNYITGLGYGSDDEKLFEKFWPVSAHIIGKDILRFHAGVWIGMLLSAGIPLPEAIYVHGFVTSEGQKMSKSLGNVVDPLVYVEKYGVDSLRYFLMKEIPTTDDGDFSHKRFVEVFNSELANNLGNLVNRVVMMTERYLEAKVPNNPNDKEFGERVLEFVKNHEEAVDKFDLKIALENMIALVDFGNKYIDEKKPWTMAKEGKNDEVANVLYNLLELLRMVGFLVFPVMPKTGEKILTQIGISDFKNLRFDKSWGCLEKGSFVKKGDNLFPRLEE